MSENTNSKGKRVIRDEGTSEDEIEALYISEKDSQEMKNNRIKKNKRKKSESESFEKSINELEKKKKRISTYNSDGGDGGDGDEEEGGNHIVIIHQYILMILLWMMINLNTSNYFANNEENLKDEDGNDSNNGNSNGGSSGSNNRQNGNNNNNNEIIPFEENIKILEYDVDVNVCGVGDMLSNQCPLLNGKGLGYLLHSVEVHVSPLPNNGNNLFGLKGISQPRQINRNIEISKGNEKSYEGKVGISKTPGVDFTGGYKKSNNIQYSSNEWKLFYKGPNTKGERWLYQYIDNDLDKDGSYRENFVPGVHSSQWFIYEGMHGFCITITQVLRCEITRGWRRFLPNTKTLLQKFPIMAHNLNVTFNDLEDFNSKLKSLNKTCYYNSDDIGVIVGSNENEKKIVNKPQNIQNLVGKIDRSLGLK
ncbi:hypothetical protein RhiirC2_707909 [Rhizophagus irregularis]|uniref:Uncharacterized protein n=1 Tax=Rhizophagus irregularis TaxID=588596 RepID=A0A2N1NPJ5_9GLOM|nr:hypothetical protein RhiirC2_707909 [Rhizophagus irregularis]